MRKVIGIGQSILNVLYQDGAPVASYPGGEIIHTMAALSNQGIGSSFISEIANDKVGKIILSYMRENGLPEDNIDLYVEGKTPISFIFDEKENTETVVYEEYPTDRFNVVWPRIEKNDIVVFGGYYTLHERLRQRFYELLTYAHERKAIIVYAPEFGHNYKGRVTRVMPYILENLEMSDIVIGEKNDFENMFAQGDANKLYVNNISFYTPRMIYFENDNQMQLHIPHDSKVWNSISVNSTTAKDKLLWHSNFIAAFVRAIIDNEVLYETLPTMKMADWDTLMSAAIANNSKLI